MGDGLTIRQLLHSLREQVVSILQYKSLDLTLEEAREYVREIEDALLHTRCLVNSFHVTVRVPPEILSMICSHLPTESDIFSASQVCHHWRSVLISSPSLWTQLSCRYASRTIAKLERCKSTPIQLEFSQRWSTVALESVLHHGNEITSLAVHCDVDPTPLLHQLLALSGPSIERLAVYCEKWGGEESTVDEIWEDLPSLRELFVCRYSIPINLLAAPNLVHLAMEQGGCSRDTTIQSILDMLRGCPLLETLLIIRSNNYTDRTHDYPPVPLPHLRSIELGAHEVDSLLMTHLQFPPNVAVGFRALFMYDLYGDVLPLVMATMRHVLRRIDIHRITLAIISDPRRHSDLLVRFDGPQSSLEVTGWDADTDARLLDALLGPRGVIFSHSPRTENVRELYVVGCSFNDYLESHHVNAAMPNLVSITFFDCTGPHKFGLLTPTDPSSPPFPYLERIMILGPASGLGEMARARRDCGIPLKTLVVGREPREFEYDHPEDYSALGEFVNDLRVGCPTEILEWGADNEVVKIWSAAGVPGPYVYTTIHRTFKFCRFDVPG